MASVTKLSVLGVNGNNDFASNVALFGVARGREGSAREEKILN